jgi:hypothetical protein
VHWKFPDGSRLTLLTNLGAPALSGVTVPAGQMIYASEEVHETALKQGKLSGWSVAWFLES